MRDSVPSGPVRELFMLETFESTRRLAPNYAAWLGFSA